MVTSTEHAFHHQRNAHSIEETKVFGNPILLKKKKKGLLIERHYSETCSESRIPSGGLKWAYIQFISTASSQPSLPFAGLREITVRPSSCLWSVPLPPHHSKDVFSFQGSSMEKVPAQHYQQKEEAQEHVAQVTENVIEGTIEMSEKW